MLLNPGFKKFTENFCVYIFKRKWYVIFFMKWICQVLGFSLLGCILLLLKLYVMDIFQLFISYRFNFVRSYVCGSNATVDLGNLIFLLQALFCLFSSSILCIIIFVFIWLISVFIFYCCWVAYSCFTNTIRYIIRLSCW